MSVERIRMVEKGNRKLRTLLEVLSDDRIVARSEDAISADSRSLLALTVGRPFGRVVMATFGWVLIAVTVLMIIVAATGGRWKESGVAPGIVFFLVLGACGYLLVRGARRRKRWLKGNAAIACLLDTRRDFTCRDAEAMIGAQLRNFELRVSEVARALHRSVEISGDDPERQVKVIRNDLPPR